MAPPKIVVHLLYGIPCVGKSTAAIRLAHDRDIRTIIHTDYVREVLRGFSSPDLSPALATVTHTAWQRHGSATPANIIAGFIDHVAAVSAGTRLVVRKLVSDGFDAVIEGVHFHGSIIEDLRAMSEHADIRPTLLVINTAEELAQRIDDKERRRASPGAERKQWWNNIPIMLVIQDHLISDARTHGIRILTTDEWTTCELANAYTPRFGPRGDPRWSDLPRRGKPGQSDALPRL